MRRFLRWLHIRMAARFLTCAKKHQDKAEKLS